MVVVAAFAPPPFGSRPHEADCMKVPKSDEMENRHAVSG
jgi:hypothetical protein